MRVRIRVRVIVGEREREKEEEKTECLEEKRMKRGRINPYFSPVIDESDFFYRFGTLCSG